ncbi:hypothetical protein [Acetobacter estunensis]|uniref:hypothetical protein n=1 Tax=Acetobacter estunensis TaxID=104097 RepID=UPI0020C51FF4|nr:hypothetical protein [Acetobacter estunensis]
MKRQADRKRFPRSSFRFFCISALFGLGLFPILAQAGEFKVEDGKASEEISEISRLYVDGELAATFTLDNRTPEKQAIIHISDTHADHSYALCGEIVIEGPDGHPVTREVSSEGTLHSPDGHTFQAMGAHDFTDFFLMDPTSPSTAQHTAGRTGACTVATS